MSRRTGQAANPRALALLKTRQDELEARAKSDLVAVMSTPQGRRFVWGLIDERAGVFGPSYASDALATAYNEGRRSVGIGLLTRAQSDARELYVEALQEQLKEQHLDATTREAAKAVPEENDTDA